MMRHNASHCRTPDTHSHTIKATGRFAHLHVFWEVTGNWSALKATHAMIGEKKPRKTLDETLQRGDTDVSCRSTELYTDTKINQKQKHTIMKNERTAA